MAIDAVEAYALAVGLLARREHSARELVTKLGSKGVEAGIADAVLARLIAERLQSDERYTELYIRLRSEKGYGPVRIKAELRERGIDDGLISGQFRRVDDENEIDWHERAATVYTKKYGDAPAEDIKQRAKRQRFMQYRGFDHEQIVAATGDD